MNGHGKSISIGLSLMRLIENATEQGTKILVCRAAGNVEVVIRKLPPQPEPPIIIDEMHLASDEKWAELIAAVAKVKP